MFLDRSDLLRGNLPGLHYGVAVTDLDGDGAFELLVAGYGGPNRALKWDGAGFADVTPFALADPERMAIGVAAADVDADGHEEIYILNTDTFMGRKRVGDRLFALRDGAWTDLFELPWYAGQQNLTAGRSVAALDRLGGGRYGFFVASYGGPMRLYELDRFGRLDDVARAAGVNYATGGRGLVALPLVSAHMDVFAATERGPNLLLVAQGDGTYQERAQEAGLVDRREHGRGIAVGDFDGDGRFDIAYGNWEGPHRLFLQREPGRFVECAPPELAAPARVRTVIAADFDNDGYEELLFNNIGEPNRLFALRDGAWRPASIGDALEPDGLGTGAAVGDFDGDGRLELLVSHGESEPQPLSLYHTPPNGNAWLRVLPLTAAGAPARGAVVALTAGGRTQLRAVDAGSGYLCQMEPVAHFGLGALRAVDSLTVRWPGGATLTLDAPEPCQTVTVRHP